MGSMLNQQARGVDRVPREQARDRGSALVMAAIVSVVVFGLSAVMLSAANHQSSASNGDRVRQQAIDAASSGLVVAASALTRDPDYAVAESTQGATSYRVTVEKVPNDQFRRVITSVGTSSSSVRTMQQQVYLDPVEFTYGVFSEKNLVAGPTWAVTGNMYTNGDLTLGQSASREYIGHIYA